MKVRTAKATPTGKHDYPHQPAQCNDLADAGSHHAMTPLKMGGGRKRGRSIALSLLAFGTDALADSEVVDLILQANMVRRDTEAIADSLILRFGSLGGVVAAGVHELNAVKGIRLADVSNLKAVQAVAIRLTKSKLLGRPVLQNWARLADYLTSVLSHEGVEHLRVLFLNQKSFLLATALLGTGTVDHVPAYPREIVKRALQLNSTAVIIAHNHPSGCPSPSEEDISMTVRIMGALSSVGVALHDHIIVGKGALVSFRKLGVPPFAHIEPGEPYHGRFKSGGSGTRPT